jgi:hypothetical protein
MIKQLVVAALALPLIGQNPHRVYNNTTILGHQCVTSVYRPQTPGFAWAGTQGIIHGYWFVAAFGGYAPNPFLALDQWGIAAIGDFDPFGTDIFVANPTFWIIPPGDYTQYVFAHRTSSWPGGPGDIMGTSEIIVGLLPVGSDFTMQVFFTTPSGNPVISEAIRVQVQ